MKHSKKSEMLEVRISHEDKLALQAKAADEARTVSFIVRRLISDYLAQPKARSKLNFVTELLMALKSKPKTILASLVCLFAPLAYIQMANAEDISILLDGEYYEPVEENGTEGIRSRTFKTEVHLESGNQIDLDLGGNLRVLISVQQRGEQLLIDMAVTEQDKLIASPKMTTRFDIPVSVEVGDKSGETFILSALPTKI